MDFIHNFGLSFLYFNILEVHDESGGGNIRNSRNCSGSVDSKQTQNTQAFKLSRIILDK